MNHLGQMTTRFRPHRNTKRQRREEFQLALAGHHQGTSHLRQRLDRLERNRRKD